MAKLDARFYLDYMSVRHGRLSVSEVLPAEPDHIHGSCIRGEGDTAVLTMRWSVFNFSLVYTQNPEGNSYYLNSGEIRMNIVLSPL